MFNFIKKYLINLLLLLSIFFLVRYFYNINILEQMKRFIIYDYSLFFYSLIFIFFSRILEYFAWYKITKDQNINFNLINTYLIWTKSEIIKYIPGKIFFLYSKFSLYKKFDNKKVYFSLFAEFTISLISLIILILFLFKFTIFNDHFNSNIYYFLLFFIILLGHFICNFLLKKFDRKFNFDLNLSMINFYKIAIAYLFSIFFYAVSLVFLFLSINANYGFDSIINVIFVFLLSNFISILVFFLPAGLGAREYFFIEISAYVLLGEFSYCIVMLRVITIFLELMMFLSSYFLKLFNQNTYSK
tara:strand:- start:22408 stop:23310 length:903 start_codon:yes stop_codon:yes gene_type:complete